MLFLNSRIEPFVSLGDRIRKYVNDNAAGSDWEKCVKSQSIYNPWYIEPFVKKALNLWGHRLSSGSLVELTARYPGLAENRTERNVAVVAELNVPLAGFQDLIMVLLAGHHFYGRIVNHEHDLLQMMTHQLISIEPEFENFIHWGPFPRNIDNYLLNSRPGHEGAFLSYFEKKKNLIRKSNISIAIISPDDDFEEMKLLGEDIFNFFGLGRYSVRKVFMPRKFKVQQFFEPLESFAYLYQYNRYANNYDYHKSVFMMNLMPFYDNGFLILRESSELQVPVGCLYFEYYDTIDEVQDKISLMGPYIQKIVTNLPGFPNAGKPGTSHNFPLWEFEGHQDTLQFLLKL